MFFVLLFCKYINNTIYENKIVHSIISVVSLSVVEDKVFDYAQTDKYLDYLIYINGITNRREDFFSIIKKNRLLSDSLLIVCCKI